MTDVPIRDAHDVFNQALDEARIQARPHDVWLHPKHSDAVRLMRDGNGRYLAALNDAGIWNIAGTHVRFSDSVPEDVAQVRLRASYQHDTLVPQPGASG